MSKTDRRDPAGAAAGVGTQRPVCLTCVDTSGRASHWLRSAAKTLGRYVNVQCSSFFSITFHIKQGSLLCPHSFLPSPQEKHLSNTQVRLSALREGGKVMVVYVSVNVSYIRTDLPHRSSPMGPSQD